MKLAVRSLEKEIEVLGSDTNQRISDFHVQWGVGLWTCDIL